jgi:hypothetical protein
VLTEDQRGRVPYGRGRELTGPVADVRPGRRRADGTSRQPPVATRRQFSQKWADNENPSTRAAFPPQPGDSPATRRVVAGTISSRPSATSERRSSGANPKSRGPAVWAVCRSPSRRNAIDPNCIFQCAYSCIDMGIRSIATVGAAPRSGPRPGPDRRRRPGRNDPPTDSDL